MQTVVHKAQDRWHAQYDWLETHHSFSFAHYYNSEMMGFGVLRVINDDTIAWGRGFGMHAHDNMEIITIPFSWALKHQDNIDWSGIINSGDIQVMSAGRGIMHSEYNASASDPVHLFQVWILPKQRWVTPRYDQKTFSVEWSKNQFQLLVSPDARDGSLMIYQDAFVSRISLDAGEKAEYICRNKVNGSYIIVVSGSCVIADETLDPRDAIGVMQASSIPFQAISHTQILVFEVPMIDEE